MAKPHGGYKNPHAVALGKKGGEAGGPARAKALGPNERSEIARKGGVAKAHKGRS